MQGSIDELQMYGDALTRGQINFLNEHPELAIEPSTYVVGDLKMQVDVGTRDFSVFKSDSPEMSITHVSPHTVTVLGYTIASALGQLLPADGRWDSLDDQGLVGSTKQTSRLISIG